VTLIVNMFGGPGAGKSTQAAGLFYRLKMKGINCELITEKAKDLTWEKNFMALDHQLFVSASQVYRQERLEGQVDCLITDSPILLGIFYAKADNSSRNKHLANYLLAAFDEKDNFNVYIKRKNNYSFAGRNQTKEEAEEIDKAVIKFIDYHNIPLFTVDGSQDGLDQLTNAVCGVLRRDGIIA